MASSILVNIASGIAWRHAITLINAACVLDI